MFYFLIQSNTRMKKVCHITTVHNYRDTRIFHKECTTLVEAGYEVHLIVANQKEGLERGIHLHNIDHPVHTRLERMRKLGKFALEKALKLNAAIYHFHDPELLPVGLALKKRGKTVIYDVHEDVPRQLASKPYLPKMIAPFVAYPFERYENYVARKLDYIITATPFIRDRFLTINSQTIDINNFPKIDILQPLKENTQKTRDLCYIGAITEIRGFYQIIKMLEYTEARLTLAGKFESPTLEEQLKRMPGWSQVDYLGQVPWEEVGIIMAESKIGLVTFLPVPNHINAQPNKLFEYMSSGIPVVLSHFPLWKQLVDDYNFGYCVDPNIPKEIAYAVNTLLNQPETAEKMGVNGRKAVENHLNWKAESIKLLEVYQKLLEKNNA